MKILVLDEEFPYPLNTGKRIRTFNLVSRLAAHHEIHYLAYGAERSESFTALRDARLHPLAVAPQVPDKSGPVFYLRLAANLVSSLPYIVSSHYSTVFAEAVERCHGELSPDLILCEWSPYAVFLKPQYQAKSIIVAHNIEARIWQRYHETETNAAKKWYIGRQAVKVDAFERAAFKRVDGATAVSSDEADAIRSMSPGLRVEVIDNGVDLDFFTADDSAPDLNRMVFTGAMDWRPNHDAAHWFVKEVFPRLRSEHPDLQVTFVGRNPPAHIVDLQAVDGVTVTGTVDDVRPYIREAAVYIVPLRVGGGSRLKILEAMAMEKAIVSTSVGAEGLKVDSGRHLELADSAEEFAQTVSTLLGDADRRGALGQAGRKLVEEHYGWDAIATKLDGFLCEIVGLS